MTAETTPRDKLSLGDERAGGTTHARLVAWVAEVAELTQPDAHPLVHRLGRGVDRADRRARRGRHVHPAQPGQEAELVPLRLRPDRRGPGRGPHLHLQPRRDGRRRHQQLDGAGRDEGDHDRALPRLDARSHDVRHPVLHGPAQRAEPDVRRRDHRLGVRRRLDAHHDPDGRRRAAPDRGAGRRLRPLPALGRRAARAGPGRRRRGRATTPSTSCTSPRSGRSGPTAPATAATPCSARSATRCGSPR